MEQTVILLKTKSSPQDPYEEALSNANLEPVFVPLLEHSFVDHEGLVESLGKLASNANSSQQPSGIIITSQRAVEAIESAVESLEKERIISRNDSKSVFFSIPVYTVGPSTAKAIARIGFTNVRGGSHAGNGDILADLILEEFSLESHTPSLTPHFIFYTGKIRRDIIPKRLRNHSAPIKVTEVEVYQTDTLSDADYRVQQSLNKTSQNSRNWLVFFSPSGTQPVIEWLANKKQSENLSLKIASIGPTTRDYLKSNNIPCNAMASKPDAQHLAEALVGYYQNN